MEIIRPAGILFGEIRYSFNPVHRSLKDLLTEYWRIPGEIFAKMNRVWRYLRKPTFEEQKWLELFYGEKIAGEIIRGNHFHRRSYRQILNANTLGKMLKTFTNLTKEDRYEIINKTTKKEKERIIRELEKELGIFTSDGKYQMQLISDFDESIEKTISGLQEKYADTIQKHGFPLKALAEMIYPQFIRRAH